MRRHLLGRQSHRIAATAIILASMALVGCAGSGYFVVDAPPPPLRAEVVVTSPGPAYVWVPGYWGWEGGAYAWFGGAWRVPPRRGAVWIAPHHESRGRGWVYVRGHWR